MEAKRLTELLRLKWAATKRPHDYQIALTHWAQFLGSEHGFTDLGTLLLLATQQNALAYAEWLQLQGYAKNTRVKYIRVARQVYDLAMKAGIRADNPFLLVRLPKQTRERPLRLIPFDKVPALIDSPTADTEKGRSHRAVMALLFGCALRRSEIPMLRPIDICHSTDGTAYLILRDPKAGTVQQQAVPEWAMERLYAAMRDRFEEGAGPTDLIFQFNGQTIDRLFKRYCKAIGLPGTFSPHSARATAITKLLSDGVPMREVQHFARHSHSWITEKYDGRAYGVNNSAGKKLNF
jgi:integrase/recombinase XerD